MLSIQTFVSWVRCSLEVSHEYAADCVKDIPDARLAEQPPGVPNHAAWTLGHLAWGLQLDAEQLGVAGWLPGEWGTLFGTGSEPRPDRSIYPPRDTLVNAINDGRERLLIALGAGGTELLGRPLPDEMIRRYLPTIGHMVTQIVVAHTAYHIGQLMVWRRAMGFGGIGYPYL